MTTRFNNTFRKNHLASRIFRWNVAFNVSANSLRVEEIILFRWFTLLLGNKSFIGFKPESKRINESGAVDFYLFITSNFLTLLFNLYYWIIIK